MICNGMGQLFIPGSSIKGAITTAIAYHLLKHGDRYQIPSSKQVSEIEKTLRQKLGQLNPLLLAVVMSSLPPYQKQMNLSKFGAK